MDLVPPDVSQPAVLLRGPDGQVCWLVAGDLIGRSPAAKMNIPDPRVSELQAHVSHRAQGLMLRALRGMLRGRSGRRAEIVLAAGQRIHLVRDVTIEVISVHLPEARPVAVTSPSGQIDPPMTLELRQETVLIHRSGRPTAELAGMSARIVSEIARFDAPTPWEWVAREIWRGELPRDTLRQRWDRNNRTLRRKLRELGVREDLVRADWSGNVELVLGLDDEVIDRA